MKSRENSIPMNFLSPPKYPPNRPNLYDYHQDPQNFLKLFQQPPPEKLFKDHKEPNKPKKDSLFEEKLPENIFKEPKEVDRKKYGFVDLPIRSAKYEIIARLRKEKVLIVTAETGSGKTTQLPQYAVEAFPGSGLTSGNF